VNLSKNVAKNITKKLLFCPVRVLKGADLKEIEKKSPIARTQRKKVS